MSDLSGLGLLTWVYPPGLVDRVVAACGRAEQRQRLLPVRLVVYFVLRWPCSHLPRIWKGCAISSRA
uniref:Transposase domain-containing protein n=1 Tax=Streptomyces sp. NBC_00119 TaxID=2975659 RepID=A0AAU1UGD9_9ACTN